MKIAKYMLILILICTLSLFLSGEVAATNQTVISSYANQNLTVANDEGARFNDNGNVTGENNTYNFFNSSSQTGTQGQNALHITPSNASDYGNVTFTTAQSGTFYISDTGGRGWDDDGILMIAINGTIPDNFKIHIIVSGYTWTPVTTGTYPNPNNLTYSITLDETFTKADFIYGPQTWKPCPANNYPIFEGQDMTNSSNTFSIIFIDLWAGILGSNTRGSSAYSGINLTDNGMLKVTYEFYDLQEGSLASFGAYAYCHSSDQGSGIRWLNRVGSTGASGYNVIGVNVPPKADFSTSTTSGTSPLTVKFTDKSTGTQSITYAWDFNGDGIIDSTDPNPSYTYTTPGNYTVTETVTNIAGTDKKTINITVSNVDIVAPTPSANLSNGSYNTNQTINLNVTDDQDPNPKIYYTLNGDDPTTNSTRYTGPIHLNSEGTTTLKFIAVDESGNISNIITKTYTIDKTAPAANKSLPSGVYNTTKNITLNAIDNLDSNPTIYYTTDGSDPRTSNTKNKYTNSISVNTNIATNTILKFAAVDAAGNWSPVYIGNYTIKDTTAPIPSADLPSGTYNTTKVVDLSAIDDTDSSPKIYYTLNGTNPTTKSTLYTWPISISNEGTTVLKFIAVDTSGNIANIITKVYTLNKPSSSGTWNISILDTNIMYNSIAIDKSGYAHIAYYQKAASATAYPKLKYAYEDKNGWHIETVATTTSGSGYYVSLVLDSSGNPHIAYSESTPDILWYAYKDSKGWHFSALANDTDVSYINLVLYKDEPRISYYENTEEKVKYMYYNGTTWITENVTSTPVYGHWNSLAIDSSGNPNISYYNFNANTMSGILKYAVRTANGTWISTTVDNSGDVGLWNSLALDSSNNPRISYEMGDGGLKYAYWDGTQWIIETVSNLESVASKLVLDQSNTPYIIYQDVITDNLEYAHKEGSNWIISNIDTINGAGHWISIALSPSGIPSVSYMSANSRLTYANLIPFKVNVNSIGGSYNKTQSITLTSTKGTTIYYTKDGSDPRTSSTRIKYTASIIVNSTITLKFAAVDSASNWSPVNTETYVINDKIAPTASASVKSGLYNTSKSVKLSMNEIGTIYYTLNGSTPTTSSKKYTGAFTVTSTHTLKFLAVDAVGNKSLIYTLKYTIDKTAPKITVTSIKNGVTGVSRSKTISIKLSENIVKGVNWSKVYIKNLKTGQKCKATIWISGNHIYITTSKKAANTLYQVYIPASAVKDSAGNNLAKGYILRFKTGK